MVSVTFVNIADPYNMEVTPEPEPPNQAPSNSIVINRVEAKSVESFSPFGDAQGLEALSTAAASNYDYIRPQYVTTFGCFS